MSDTESFHPREDQRNNDDNFDQRLDDHRNQPSFLPVPTGEVDYGQPIGILGQASSPRYQRRSSRSHSFGEGGLDPKDQRHLNASQGISFKAASTRKKSKTTKGDNLNLEADLASPMTRYRTNDTSHSSRRASSSSIDSEQNSHGSRSSQETEEDVCFPMLREHVRVNGIDFDEIDEFINEERDHAQTIYQQQQLINENLKNSQIAKNSVTSSQSRYSSASLKYTPKNILKKTTSVFKKNEDYLDNSGDNDNKSVVSTKEQQQGSSDSSTDYEKVEHSPASDDFVTFSGARVNEQESFDGRSSLPERFSFFSTQIEETIHSPDIPSLTSNNQSIKEVFNNGEGTWWLDCTCPTDAEMKVISKAFGLHPLTSEDIRVQESREKVELFKNYYFVCFHTFEQDKESEDYLEPINVYVVVFREGILTFHFSPINHGANVRRRVRQLRDYVDVSADWICYAIIDDITDAFIPVITGIEYEADAIEDSVFVARETDFGLMLQRIGESRRKVMTLMRLLSGKADVIKMFAKRCQDETYLSPIPNQSQANLSNMANYGFQNETGNNSHATSPPVGFGPDGNAGISFGPRPGAPPSMMAPNQYQFHHPGNITQPRADIALYLGDIQDHVVTMFQNLMAYEKIFSRSHANYLAQLQVESVNSNNKVTVMLSQVTLLGTLLLPLNVITGLFGMNVTVPGEATGSLNWFFGILAIMFTIVGVFFFFARIYLKKLLYPTPEGNASSGRRSIRSLGLRRTGPAKSIVSYPNFD